ncbi:NAD-P-binding protein [Epithele typhae]|uniref:NAD-P-binding protein n=1 Tax=Epithele typhae TaxID=378194 RepID=UPI0020079F21|nr:NAD-P-binding protein [Epithele typhae]KAH9916612.1 NAD-P-binding protein [Epithele typhae]
MPSYAIVGASRGIGLEYVRQLASREDSLVFAIARNASAATFLQAAVQGTKNVHVLEADVADYKSLSDAAQVASAVSGGLLDCLIHNAARMEEDSVHKSFDSFATMDELDVDFTESFKVNALGPIHAIQAFLPLLRASTTKKIVVISTAAVDPKFVRAIRSDRLVAYGMTKSAALIATTKWAVKLADEGFSVVSLSPGVVDVSSSMGDGEAWLAEMASTFTDAGFADMEMQSVDQSVRAQLKVIDGMTVADNGKFLTHTGTQWPGL